MVQARWVLGWVRKDLHADGQSAGHLPRGLHRPPGGVAAGPGSERGETVLARGKNGEASVKELSTPLLASGIFVCLFVFCFVLRLYHLLELTLAM